MPPNPSPIPNTLRPNLWFDGNALEAAQHYCKVFPRSRITAIRKAPSDYPGGGQQGQVLTVEFELMGRPFLGLNGGSQFRFCEAVSFEVAARDEAEVDRYYEALSAFPENEQCGWVKDRFGLSWQIVPRRFYDLMAETNPAVGKAVFQAMMPMKRLDMDALEQVANRARGSPRAPAASKTAARTPAATRSAPKAARRKPSPTSKRPIKTKPKKGAGRKK